MPNQLFIMLQEAFQQNKNHKIAVWQQNYMKSKLPHWGIKVPILRSLCKEIFAEHQPTSQAHYAQTILYLINNATHREVWWAAVEYAKYFKKFATHASIPTYLNVIEKCQWWDIVDPLATDVIGKALLQYHKTEELLTTWISHENMWVRRTALLVQLLYKEKTNFELLARLIIQVAHEKEFFIRKAIGWALRHYARTNPAAVALFVEEYQEQLSPLSKREALKHINKKKLKFPSHDKNNQEQI